MWIRSQYREILSNCVEFYLQENLKESYAVLGVAKNRSGHFIATYSSKRKALKVLDMIQRYIEHENELDKENYQITCDNCKCKYVIVTGYKKVFEMPLDSEVVDDE